MFMVAVDLNANVPNAKFRVLRIYGSCNVRNDKQSKAEEFGRGWP
jgi:hypothetical protein